MGRSNTHAPRYEVWRGRNGKGYWHARVSGRIVAGSGQGYSRVTDARRAARARAKRDGGKVFDR